MTKLWVEIVVFHERLLQNKTQMTPKTVFWGFFFKKEFASHIKHDTPKCHQYWQTVGWMVFLYKRAFHKKQHDTPKCHQYWVERFFFTKELSTKKQNDTPKSINTGKLWVEGVVSLAKVAGWICVFRNDEYNCCSNEFSTTPKNAITILLWVEYAD